MIRMIYIYIYIYIEDGGVCVLRVQRRAAECVWMKWCIHATVYAYMDGWTDAWTYLYPYRHLWMDGWMDGWTDGWMDGRNTHVYFSHLKVIITLTIIIIILLMIIIMIIIVTLLVLWTRSSLRGLGEQSVMKKLPSLSLPKYLRNDILCYNTLHYSTL